MIFFSVPLHRPPSAALWEQEGGEKSLSPGYLTQTLWFFRFCSALTDSATLKGGPTEAFCYWNFPLRYALHILNRTEGYTIDTVDGTGPLTLQQHRGNAILNECKYYYYAQHITHLSFFFFLSFPSIFFFSIFLLFYAPIAVKRIYISERGVRKCVSSLLWWKTICIIVQRGKKDKFGQIWNSTI